MNGLRKVWEGGRGGIGRGEFGWTDQGGWKLNVCQVSE